MIARILGEVIDVRVHTIVVNVNGVGYLIFVPGSAGYTIGHTVDLHTHLAVRENALDLYGFTTRDELTMFDELIKLPKIGPKTALQILSQTSLEILTKAIQEDDPSYLSKMSGIGKKNAEKIVSGLRDALDFESLGNTGGAPRLSDADVIDALMSLGYTQKDALQAAQRIPNHVEGTNERIKQALRYIGE